MKETGKICACLSQDENHAGMSLSVKKFGACSFSNFSSSASRAPRGPSCAVCGAQNGHTAGMTALEWIYGDYCCSSISARLWDGVNGNNCN